MSAAQQNFATDSLAKAFDLSHRATISHNISLYEKSFAKGRLQYKNLALARKRLAVAKHKVIDELDKYLVEFEANFTARGGKVLWAPDAGEALKEIESILKKYDAKSVVKSKSMITEEIELNEFLASKGVEVTETDLGEYIVQISDDKPYHIITPIMHKSKEDVASLFHEKFNLSPEATPEEITAYVRDKLRDKFTTADVGITGANFLIADTGSIAITENEGNAIMSTSFPQIHIAIVGIDKMIASIRDLDLIWPLLATHGTGQKMTAYNTVLSGPRQDAEGDGPAEMYVVLVDNGRTDLLKHKAQRRAMSCIRCGACLNFCPIYRNIGGHSYGTVYSGPIGAVIAPHLLGLSQYKHLSYASSLCGRCTEVCPAHINLHELIIKNRREVVIKNYVSGSDKFVMSVMKRVLMKRSRMEMGNAGIKNFLLKKLFSKHWGPRREMPQIQKKSFNKLWKEHRPF